MPRYRDQFTPAADGGGVWVLGDSVDISAVSDRRREDVIDGIQYVNTFISVVSATSRAYNQEMQRNK